MELVCLERLSEKGRPAQLDPNIFQDPRVLDNLLRLEATYTPSKEYFSEELVPYMRKVITSWMLEVSRMEHIIITNLYSRKWMRQVCEDQSCEEQVFPLAVNFFDRFLSVCQVKSSQLQLSAAACLLLASKVRACVPLSLAQLAYSTANSVTPSEIKDWEMLLLSKLRWEVCGITGFDFIDVFLQNLQFSKPSNLLRSHALTLLALACTDSELMCMKGSVVSCAALTAAARGLRVDRDILPDLCLLAHADPALVESIVLRIETNLAQEALRHQCCTKPKPTCL